MGLVGGMRWMCFKESKAIVNIGMLFKKYK
jgi:hypothetical protein